MDRKLGAALLGIVLVFPMLTGYVLAEEQNTLGNEKIQFQDTNEKLPIEVKEPETDEDLPIQGEEPDADEDLPIQSEEPDADEDLPIQSEEPDADEDHSQKLPKEEIIGSSEQQEQISDNNDALSEEKNSEVTQEPIPASKEIEVETATDAGEGNLDDGVVIKGNIHYYFNNEGNLTYAEVYSENSLVEIHEFFPDTDLTETQNNIQYIFKVNSNGFITNASQMDKQTQQVINHYQYYSETVFGNHGNNIKYIFDLNDLGLVVDSSLREKGTQRVLSRYQYYPNTAFGEHAYNIKYIFDLNDLGFVVNSSLREKGTQRVLSRYQYYPDTAFGEHAYNIKYIFDLNPTGHVTIASLREQGTQRILSRYQYYPGTFLGNRAHNIKYIFDLNHSGHITNSSLRELDTQRIISTYQYYPGTVFGQHAYKIKYIFDVNPTGYVTNTSLREQGTQRVLSRFEYYPNSIYGKHPYNIKYIFDMNAAGYVTNASLREQGTQRVLSVYQYLPKTTYGNRFSKIGGVKLNIPIIGQLPELPTGCEITAVTMMLQYKGIHKDKIQLANEMPRHSWDPRYGYVGNPYSKNGWTIYPPALMELIKKYAGSAQNLTGASHLMLENRLLNSKPVVVWVSPMHGFTVHALTLTGYDTNNYYYNDPWTGEKNVKINKNEFIKIWINQSKRAISY